MHPMMRAADATAARGGGLVRAVLVLALGTALAAASVPRLAHAEEPPPLDPTEPASEVSDPAGQPAPEAGSAPVEGVAVTPVHVPAPAPPPAPPPRDLRSVEPWLRWKEARQLASLPVEARIFHRRGLLAMQSGQRAEAFADVRGAAELDPSFLDPHVTLAGWLAFRDPAQALVHAAAVVDRARHDFDVQVDLAANAVMLGLEAMFAGLLLAGLLLVFLRRDELSHAVAEWLATWVSRPSARGWSWLVLALPFLAGVGVVLPVVLMLGLLWPRFRWRERTLSVFVALAALAAPFAHLAVDRFTLALQRDARPFHEAPGLESLPWDADRQARLEHAATQDPSSGFAQFALGWHSRAGGRLEQAETAYESALRAWPEHTALLTNLGNVMAMRGASDRALELYRRAVASDPANAAAHFNAAQLLTRRFEYARANEELRQASAIDFDLVQRYQSQAGNGGMLPLVDVWPAPPTFWRVLRATPVPPGLPLPFLLRGHLETRGLGFALAALLAFVGGLFASRWQERRLPLRRCTNCGVVVCRRCARRRRENALCQACDRISGGAETQDFSRVLLLQHRGRRRDRQRALTTALALLVPGYGLLAHRRVLAPVLLITLTWLLVRLSLSPTLPYSITARLVLPGDGPPLFLLAVGFLFVYAWSLSAYVVVSSIERRRQASLEAVARDRIAQPDRRQPPAAA